MGTASFYGGVHHKRYSGQQEIAPKKNVSSFRFQALNNLKLET